jgi:hypothetical protein
MNKLLSRIAEIVTRIYVFRKKSKFKLIQFKDVIPAGARTVIIMPTTAGETAVVAQLLESISERFKNSSLIIHQRFRSQLSPRLHNKVEEYFDTDITFLNLPKAKLRTRLAGLKPDVVISFPSHGNLFNPFLTASINANFKIGFAGDFSEHIFHFQYDSTVKNVDTAYAEFVSLWNLL